MPPIFPSRAWFAPASVAPPKLEPAADITALQDIQAVAVTVSAIKGDRKLVLAQGFDDSRFKSIDAAMRTRITTEAPHDND